MDSPQRGAQKPSVHDIPTVGNRERRRDGQLRMPDWNRATQR